MFKCIQYYIDKDKYSFGLWYNSTVIIFFIQRVKLQQSLAMLDQLSEKMLNYLHLATVTECECLKVMIKMF